MPDHPLTDIFSFGTVLYEMVAGRQPFRGNNRVAVLAAIVRDEPEKLSALAPSAPAELEKLIARGQVTNNDRVIVISTANGLKFSEFKTAYHTNQLAGIAPRHANPPVELPNDYDAVRRAIERLAVPSGGR